MNIQSAFPIGSVIGGQYEVLDVLGHGGMGVVLRVRRKRDRKELALKYCNVAADEAIRRFAREVRAMQEISHPNVMRVLDVNLESDPPYFVMPLAVGSLADEDLRSNEPEALNAFVAILEGVQAIHASGGTHRDLKPANAMRLPNGTVVVSDLGLVKLDPRDTTILTQTAQFVGTRKYCAPEQMLPQGSRNADARTDVYQLGKTLYELVTGEDAALVNPDVLPSGLAHIVRRATREAPAERYKSIAELRDALESYMRAKAPNAQPVQRFDVLLQQAAELLKGNEYKPEILRELCSILAHLDEREDETVISMFTQLDPRLLRVLGANMPDDLEPALGRYSKAIDALVGGRGFSFAETVANQMKVVFDSATGSHLRCTALRTAMVAAVALWRFAAMDTFDEMLKATSRDDDAMAFSEMLREEQATFAKLANRYTPTQLHPIIRSVWEEVQPKE